MEETIRCEYCGGASPADAAYCIDCGMSLSRPATGPTQRLELPRPQVYTRPAAPPAYAPPAAHRVPPPAPSRSNKPNLTMPMLIIGAALIALLVPRFGPMALVAVGVVGLLIRTLLTNPSRVVPLLVLCGFVVLMFTGGKLFWPLLIGMMILRGLAGHRRWW